MLKEDVHFTTITESLGTSRLEKNSPSLESEKIFLLFFALRFFPFVQNDASCIIYAEFSLLFSN